MIQEPDVQFSITLAPGARMPDAPMNLWPVTKAQSGATAIITTKSSRVAHVEAWLRSIPGVLTVERIT